MLSGAGVSREVTDTGVREQPIGEAHGDGAFAARLGDLLAVPAYQFTGPGLPEPGHGTLVICRADGLHELATANRTRLGSVVLIDAGRTRALAQAEAYSLAAAVETNPYTDWLTGRTLPEPSLFARRDMATALGGVPDGAPGTQGAHYGRFRFDGLTDVAAVLAHYLKALSQ